MDIPLRLARFSFQLQCQDPIHLPAFSGATLRGGFGLALRKAFCAIDAADCRGCSRLDQCRYPYLFETSHRGTTEDSRRFRSAPRPFVLKPPPGPADFGSGDLFELSLVLVGGAIDEFPGVAAAVAYLGFMGLGHTRGEFRIKTIENLGQGQERACLYNAGDASLGQPCHVIDWHDLERRAEALAQIQGDGEVGRVDVEFLSPTRIEEQDDLAVEPDFPVLARAMVRRLTTISEIHCGGAWCPEPRFLDSANQVKVSRRQLQWVDERRFSTRQKVDMALGGVTGFMEFEGPLRPFLPFLLASEMLHVGKGTTFGLGHVRLTIPGALASHSAGLAAPP